MQNESFGYSDSRKNGDLFYTTPDCNTAAIAPCPSCGSIRVNVVAMPQHCTHHSARRCGGCDRFLSWEQKPANQQKRQRQQETIGQLLEVPGLSQWEKNFLLGVKGKKTSPRQMEVLRKIQEKVGGVA